METIKAATVSAADLLGQSDHLGTLEPGKYADLVAVPRNPLDDISVMGEVSLVMKAGTVYKQGGTPMEVIAPGR
jgi:imidazolonepropionase-like amidohydrolase